MERRRSLRLGVALFALSVAAVPNTCGRAAKQKREDAYQAALKSYSDILKPGMTRKELENYLRTKGIAFQQMCCVEERSAFADLVKIGKEKHPWYCGAHNVYVAFQFAAVEPHDGHAQLLSERLDSDVLKSITIYHWLEGCW